MDDTMISRKKLATAAGIPEGSIERELMLIGVNSRPNTKMPIPGSNMSEYYYPAEILNQLIESRKARGLYRPVTNPEG
jgi:hypothetical protein